MIMHYGAPIKCIQLEEWSVRLEMITLFTGNFILICVILSKMIDNSFAFYSSFIEYVIDDALNCFAC